MKPTTTPKRNSLPPRDEALSMLRERLDEIGLGRLALNIEKIQDETGWGTIVLEFKNGDMKRSHVDIEYQDK